ncbi:hypothetical protein [Nocardioides convexus]|uniref:hypothetical protein n=1 Tax=Nocardioides convexus TaxID=2712224 RepID=UPI002418A9BB|nr:hypothetical protein [Nocardioides convexus]
MKVSSPEPDSEPGAGVRRHRGADLCGCLDRGRAPGGRGRRLCAWSPASTTPA